MRFFEREYQKNMSFCPYYLTYFPSFASKIVLGSYTSILCHAPCGICIPNTPSRGHILNLPMDSHLRPRHQRIQHPLRRILRSRAQVIVHPQSLRCRSFPMQSRKKILIDLMQSNWQNASSDTLRSSGYKADQETYNVIKSSFLNL